MQPVLEAVSWTGMLLPILVKNEWLAPLLLMIFWSDVELYCEEFFKKQTLFK